MGGCSAHPDNWYCELCDTKAELARVRDELAKASGEEHADRCAQSKRLKEMLKAERERTERVARLLYYLLFTQSTQFKENAR